MAAVASPETAHYRSTPMGASSPVAARTVSAISMKPVYSCGGEPQSARSRLTRLRLRRQAGDHWAAVCCSRAISLPTPLISTAALRLLACNPEFLQLAFQRRVVGDLALQTARDIDGCRGYEARELAAQENNDANH